MLMLEWRKICCAVDFSPSSREALRVAVRLAHRLDAELLLLHVHEAAHRVTNASSEVAQKLAIEDAMETGALRHWAHDASVECGREVEALTIDGEPAKTIVSFAKQEGCELLVVGTQGRTGLRRAIFGSVAEKVVRLAHCPVLTVHPPEEDETTVGGVV